MENVRNIGIWSFFLLTGLLYNLILIINSSLRQMEMNQKKRVESLRTAYQSMDEERRKKLELIAKGLLSVQMLVGEKRPKSRAKRGEFKNSGWEYRA
jgi:hypothetical protein